MKTSLIFSIAKKKLNWYLIIKKINKAYIYIYTHTHKPSKFRSLASNFPIMKTVWTCSLGPNSASSTYFQNFHSPPLATSNPTCSNTYKYPKFTTVKFKATHIFSALLKNKVQLNFTHLRFNFSLNTNPNSLFKKKKKNWAFKWLY